MLASLSIVLDTRRMKSKTKKYPLKLRVTYERKSWYYLTIYDLKEDEYAKLVAPNAGAGLKVIREKLKEIERSAEAAAKELFPFTFGDFEKEYILNNPSFLQRKAINDVKVEGNYEYDVSQYAHHFQIFKEPTMPSGSILVTFRSYIDKLLRADRIGSAVCYQTSYYSFGRFRGNVLFTEVTVDYLNDYERRMLKQDYSKTTIGIHPGIFGSYEYPDHGKILGQF